ncbi:MAG TPA: homoserine O-succinyltransferase [Acidimicrobiales bacterium]|nr:homoserine O-succinyltransferase [Acidimicrobiales bacterium]
MTVLLDRVEAFRPIVPLQLRVALVNNMPDSAFEETERQFRDLLGAGAGADGAQLGRYVLPDVHSTTSGVSGNLGYQDVRNLYTSPPDVLIVTGAEPKERELTDEAYWPALEELLWWARSEVPAAYLSCLAAHAALLAFDNVKRQPLTDKNCGAFAQVVNRSEPLMGGTGGVRFVHSRWNDVPSYELKRRGYRILAESVRGGWTIAADERGHCSFLLSQGHPEYDVLTLLREYRRDVRRYLSGAQAKYPSVPQGYLDNEGLALLRDFEGAARRERRDPSLIGSFPFELAAAHITARWHQAAAAMFKNWLRSVRHMAHEHSYGKKSA